MIKIGVTASFFYPDPSRVVFGHKSLSYIENDMARYLSRKDVMPILIPDFHGAEMKQFLEEMDGFVLQGGSDLAPETYGEKPIGKWKGDKYRDEYEMAIMDYVIKHDKPLYGICRGFQVMNTYFEGTLFQDITTQRPDSLVHRDADKYDQVNHGISFTEGGLLDKLHEVDPIRRVNSVHHQGVKDLGKDLEVLATCTEDGIIEAFQWKGAEEGKVVGVQWHPEFFYNFKDGDLLNPQLIYDHFLSFCKKK